MNILNRNERGVYLKYLNGAFVENLVLFIHKAVKYICTSIQAANRYKQICIGRPNKSILIDITCLLRIFCIVNMD